MTVQSKNEFLTLAAFVVPMFDYSAPGLDLNQGDEYYEVHFYDEEVKRLDDVQNPSMWNPWDAIRYAISLKAGYHAKIAQVFVYGIAYPDGSRVPDGGLIYDSRLDIFQNAEEIHSRMINRLLSERRRRSRDTQ